MEEVLLRAGVSLKMSCLFTEPFALLGQREEELLCVFGKVWPTTTTCEGVAHPWACCSDRLQGTLVFSPFSAPCCQLHTAAASRPLPAGAAAPAPQLRLGPAPCYNGGGELHCARKLERKRAQAATCSWWQALMPPMLTALWWGSVMDSLSASIFAVKNSFCVGGWQRSQVL